MGERDHRLSLAVLAHNIRQAHSFSHNPFLLTVNYLLILQRFDGNLIWNKFDGCFFTHGLFTFLYSFSRKWDRLRVDHANFNSLFIVEPDHAEGRGQLGLIGGGLKRELNAPGVVSLTGPGQLGKEKIVERRVPIADNRRIRVATLTPQGLQVTGDAEHKVAQHLRSELALPPCHEKRLDLDARRK